MFPIKEVPPYLLTRLWNLAEHSRGTFEESADLGSWKLNDELSKVSLSTDSVDSCLVFMSTIKLQRKKPVLKVPPIPFGNQIKEGYDDT